MNIKPVHDLLNKKMTRKDFLKHLGAAALGVFGVTAFLRNITDPNHKSSKPTQPKANHGYGYGRPYGS